MHRDARTDLNANFPRGASALTVGALAAGLLLAGLRELGGQSSASAQTPASKQAAKSASAFDLGYVPTDTVLLVAARPSELLKRAEFKPLLDALDTKEKAAGLMGMKPEEVEQVLIVALPNREQAEQFRARPPYIVTIMRSTKAQEWRKLTAANVPNPVEHKHAGQAYYQAAGREGGDAFFIPDARTLVMGPAAAVLMVIDAGKNPKGNQPWTEAWKGVNKGQVAFALDVAWVRQQLEAVMAQPGVADQMAMVAPLVNKANGYALGLDATKGLRLDGLATCGSAADAKEVSATLTSLRTLAKNALDQIKPQIANMPRDNAEMMRVAVGVVEPLLDKAKVEQDGKVVKLKSSSDADIAALAKTMAAPVKAARASARRMQSINNLKQIGLAFHNYISTNEKLPSSAMLGPDGKTPHSWRVAILPFIDQQALYDQYKLDEPWDSPANRKLLDKMPAIYGFPAGGGDPTHAAYFMLTGPDTLSPEEGGVTLNNITDGTSNTILAVEAKRAIPWTKPEDIPYDAAKPLPKLGGYTPDGFNTAFADGSVRFLKATIDEAVLRAFITKAGGEVIDQSKLD